MIIRRRLISDYGDEDLIRIGGRIYMVIPGDNGCEYRFFDHLGRELVVHDVLGLSTAVYYTRTGTPLFDKFYVYMTADGMPGSPYFTYRGYFGVMGVEWGAYGHTLGCVNALIGGGKINTAIALLSPHAYVGKYSLNTIWHYLKLINEMDMHGHDDWFIPNYAEALPFFENPFFSGYHHWSAWLSEEFSGVHAYMFKKYDIFSKELKDKSFTVQPIPADVPMWDYSEICLFRAF